MPERLGRSTTSENADLVAGRNLTFRPEWDRAKMSLGETNNLNSASLMRGLVWFNSYGNSRQLRFIEKWFPGERLTVGIVKMSFLQKLAYTSEIFTKERRIRQLVHVLVRCPQTKFPGRDKCRQDCRFKIMHIVRPS